MGRGPEPAPPAGLRRVARGAPSLPLPPQQPLPAVLGAVLAVLVEPGERAERLRRVGLVLGEHDRIALVDRARDVPVARDGHVGPAPPDRPPVLAGEGAP